jgi:ubiquinone biosynthesis protein
MNSSGLIGRQQKTSWRFPLVLLRLAEVAATLAGELLAYCLQKARALSLRASSRPGAVYFRTALENLGPTFIKLGQILANQVEVIPVAVQRELSTLLDHAASVPGPAIEAEIARAYGRPVNEIFDSFNAEPVASASISQVHEATLVGRRVAVKVRRPGVVAQVEVDLFILSVVARLLHLVSKRARGHNARGLAAQVADMVRAELDFEAEAANAERVRTALAGQTHAVVPLVYPELTRPNVLVMEYVDGIPLSEGAALAARGHDGRKMATTLMLSALCMMNGDRFHCDLHPGNILCLPDGRIAILDYGACGTSSPEAREALGTLLLALATADSGRLSDGALVFMAPTRPYDHARFSERLREILFPLASSSLGSITVGRVMLDLLSVMRTHGLRLQADVALLVKAMITAEATARDLHPEASFGEALLAFVAAQPVAAHRQRQSAGSSANDSRPMEPLQSPDHRDAGVPGLAEVEPVDVDLRAVPSGTLPTQPAEPQPLSLIGV